MIAARSLVPTLALVLSVSACGQSGGTPTSVGTSTETTPSALPAPARASCGSVAGNFITGLEAIGTDCATARRVARSWLAKVQRGTDPSQPIDVAGYRCGARFHGELAAVLCEQGGDPSRGRIVFSGHP